MNDILIIDDTPSHIKTASTILKNNGYTIRAANNCKTALNLIKKDKPSLILLDVYMPDKSGFDFCSELKSIDDYKDIAIIFITADNDVNSINRGFMLGGQDYITKPYNALELLARVNTHMKIIRQAKDLRASYDELDAFCHTVSHDLKSPLQVISQLTSLLRDECLGAVSDTALEIMNKIDYKSSQTILMVERLLEFSRIAEVETHFEKIDIVPIIKNILDEQTALSNRKIISHIDSLPEIYADRVLITILFQNIISNSVKFTAKRETAIINISNISDENHIIIRVSDNGAGFDMTYRDRLFNIFERLHSTDEFSGTGVGLSIVRRIIKKHGGTCDITGEVDRGANITLSFPL